MTVREGDGYGRTGGGTAETVETLRIEPVKGLEGSCTLPGDKSISHRALMLCALCEGRVRVRHLSTGEDVRSTRRCLEALGVPFGAEGEELWLEGRGCGGLREAANVLDAGNSGTTLRLLSGILASQPFLSVLTGDDSLRRRPMDRIVRPLRQMGARIWGRDGGRLAPLAIQGGGLEPITYTSPVASAQVKTAVLLAGLFLEGETAVREPHVSRDHTERMLAHLGADIRVEQRTVRLRGGRPLAARDLIVPADPSSAAFPLVAALITRRSEVEIREVGVNPTRIGYLKVLERMGASLELLGLREVCGEPVADIRVRSSALRGTQILPDEVPSCIDEIPVLCVAAAMAQGKTRITGAAELRVKESDRIAAMGENLKRMGVPVTEHPDGLEIEGQGRIDPFEGESWEDHRIALSLIVAALAAEGPCTVHGAEAMRISFPGFFACVEPLIR